MNMSWMSWRIQGQYPQIKSMISPRKSDPSGGMYLQGDLKCHVELIHLKSKYRVIYHALFRVWPLRRQAWNEFVECGNTVKRQVRSAIVP